ncbi:MAG: hypothetical protein Q9219_000861 [cf. Caloplaca sp. 3 TL-2023]
MRWAVASAVIVPETEEDPVQVLDTGKRKPSASYEESSKRPKLDGELSSDRAEPSDPVTASDRHSSRRVSGQLEERKRGKRLFGALLGTLSQSSSSTAQKRRTDIERKQQAKLRAQAEEYDEQKRQRLESIMAVRRKEQKKYDKQSMHIRHSNMLAQAHFLQTKSEPKLYYLPWELFPGEDAKIKSQIEAAEGTAQREIEQFEAEIAKDSSKSEPDPKTPGDKPKADSEKQAEDSKETVGSETNSVPKVNGLENEGSTDIKPEPSAPEVESLPVNPEDNSGDHSKEHDDDGGEMVEADEDMVIY